MEKAEELEKGCFEQKSIGGTQEFTACHWLRCWGGRFLVGDAVSYACFPVRPVPDHSSQVPFPLRV